MARIAGVDLPREMKLEIGLTYIFGIGRATARKILETTAISTTTTSTVCVRRSRRIFASKVRFAPKSR